MRFLLAVFLTLWLVLPGVAQGVDPDWKALSERTESVLESGDASAGALTALRGELADWRARFQEAQTANAARIETLTAQIEAIGPPPEEGETEPPGIGIQRSELNRRLEELRAPVREAQASFTAADGLISEVDRLLEANRAAQLLSKAPAPVNPVNWPPTVAAIASWLKAFGQELYAPFATPTARAVWQARGGELGLLVLVAILLLWRSGVWLGKLRDRVALHEADSAVARVILLTISVVRLILPVAGLFAVVRILQLMGAEGLRVDAATTLLPLMGFTILMARWLSLQALPMRETAQAFLPVSPARRPAARFYALMLGILLAGAMAVEVITQTANDPVVSNAVAHLVLLVIAGINLFRMGKLFLSEGEAARADDDDGGGGFWAQVLRLIGRGLILVGVLSPLVAAVGYVNLANAALWPAALSLALIMFIGILQGFAFDLYAAAMRRPDTGRDALLPTLVGFVLALLSLPLFALIWGVLPSTLREWWTKFQLGFDFGESRISPGSFLTLALVFLVGYLMVRLLKGVLRTSVLPKTKLDTGGTNAILSGTGYIGITIAILMAVTAAGIDLSGLAIVAGALSVGVGFGLQTIVQNFVSGIILLIERPIKLGDWVVVQASGVEGFVREISVRSTRIETFDRQDMIVPNADLISGVVTNYTLNNASGRVVLTLGVAYGSDTERVERILQEVAEEHPMVILNPPPLVTFDGFGTNGLDFTVRVVLRDILFKVVVASELNHAIAKRFKAEGLEHPLPRRDVLLRNPEALQPEGPPST